MVMMFVDSSATLSLDPRLMGMMSSTASSLCPCLLASLPPCLGAAPLSLPWVSLLLLMARALRVWASASVPGPPTGPAHRQRQHRTRQRRTSRQPAQITQQGPPPTRLYLAARSMAQQGGPPRLEGRLYRSNDSLNGSKESLRFDCNDTKANVSA